MVTSLETASVSVSLLALRETSPAALYGILEVLSSVGITWRQLTGEATVARPMTARIVARTPETFLSAIGVPIAPAAAIADVNRSDIVIVTDLELPGGATPRWDWTMEAEWVRGQFAKGATICSVCTGSIFLAETGLLDGLEATTHWSATRLFRERYPDVALRPERILCPAGPEHRIITSGGASSWEDLSLYLIARFCNVEEAVRIAKIFVFGDRSDGQLPFSAMARPRPHEDAVIGACQSWIGDHYAGPNPVARMAERSGLGQRTFKRRFKAATGYTPMDYVQALRVEEAKQLLETTNEPTDAVADAVGYEDPAFFRRLFKRRAGVTPARYRRRFQAISGGSWRG
jgi:transcriptional regulator GlxA family with amidase domain